MIKSFLIKKYTKQGHKKIRVGIMRAITQVPTPILDSTTDYHILYEKKLCGTQDHEK